MAPRTINMTAAYRQLENNHMVNKDVNNCWCLIHLAWGVAEAKCILVTAVCVCVCLSVPHHIPTLPHGPGC